MNKSILIFVSLVLISCKNRYKMNPIDEEDTSSSSFVVSFDEDEDTDSIIMDEEIVEIKNENDDSSLWQEVAYAAIQEAKIAVEQTEKIYLESIKYEDYFSQTEDYEVYKKNTNLNLLIRKIQSITYSARSILNLALADYANQKFEDAKYKTDEAHSYKLRAEEARMEIIQIIN